ncbi:MAG: sugar phosphate isomerase/epimerase [Spirochaetales bacterium]|nr:sugar phosphate isomerase/epimerase [Spirochaetales bacterium]
MAQWTYGGRLNSFKTSTHMTGVTGGGAQNAENLLERIALVEGISKVDLNYPEHFAQHNVKSLEEVLERLELTCNGIAMRFDDRFVRGDFSHPEPAVRQEALELTHQGASVCEQMGGDVLTLWFAHDGYDYAFEGDHLERYRLAVEGVRMIADRHPNIKISIEYKPYQPRAFTTFADIGTVLLAIRDIDAPNVGITLDYCHMLMKRENPAQSLAMAVNEGRLLGIHLNDGYRDNDDGMIAGTVNLLGLFEFVYYLKKYAFSGLIYFDTFPDRLDPVAELRANVEIVSAAEKWLDTYGLEKLHSMVAERSPLGVHRLILHLINES